MRISTAVALVAFTSVAAASPRSPLPDTTWDGGALSAESLGRGRTIASNLASPAAGSENPAALNDSKTNAGYVTTLVGISSKLDSQAAESSDPLDGKVLQYLAIQGEKGVIFYEPIARRSDQQLTDTPGDFREVDYSANAIGFAAADKLGAGSLGLSLAYLWSSLGVREFESQQIVSANHDTADGLRMNIGVRYPKGPFMWGAVLQNAPGFLWGKDYRKETLPFTWRLGQTWKAFKGGLLSIDWERRYYHEGSAEDSFLHIGAEFYLSSHLILRGGVFGTDINNPKKRTSTTGLSIITETGARIAYAFESFIQTDERVNRSILSVQFLFDASN